MNTRKPSPSTQKVHRLARGGKCAPGHQWQARGARVRRPDLRTVAVVPTEATLAGVAGLVEFGASVRTIGLRGRLAEAFGHSKQGRGVVYPMHEQLQLRLDVHVAGEGRCFGLEALAHDLRFVALAGGAIPSIDVSYDDLGRCQAPEHESLESIMADQDLEVLRQRRPARIHVNIDSTVRELFGAQQGAHLGEDPIFTDDRAATCSLFRVAEFAGTLGAQLRPGDDGFGANEAARIRRLLQRLRTAVGPGCVVVVRIDAAADCAEVLAVLQAEGVHLDVKARITQDLAGAIEACTTWKTVESNTLGRPTTQVADITYQRETWAAKGLAARVVAVRSRDRDDGKRFYLWEGSDVTAQAFLTNEWLCAADDVARLYDDRAGIKPLAGEPSPWAVRPLPRRRCECNTGTSPSRYWHWHRPLLGGGPPHPRWVVM